MKAAHVIHHFGRLSESFIPDALEELERIGVEGWVATLSVEGRETYPFPPSSRLVVCPEPGVARRGFDRLRGRPGAERFAEQASGRLRAVGPSLVHAHFGWSAPAGVAVARRLGVPVVATFHGTDVTVVMPNPRGHLYSDAFARLDAAIVVSDFIATKVRALGYSGAVEVIPAGVRLERMPFRAAEPDGPPRILYLGRLVEQKGLPVLLDALPRILDAAPDASLEVIGGGELDAQVRARAKQLGVAAQTRFRGPLPRRQDVYDAIRAAHVLVMPSRAMPDGQAEGSPVVTKEAQAFGVALVSTNTGGISETVPPEHRGDLVPGDDPAALAAAVSRLLADPVARRERAVRARAWVEEQFDSVHLARRTAALYGRVVR